MENSDKLSREKIVKEIESLKKELNNSEGQEKEMIKSQINDLEKRLSKEKEVEEREDSQFNRDFKLQSSSVEKPIIQEPLRKTKNNHEEKITDLEKKVLKRIKKGEEKEEKRKEKSPSKYISISNKIFFNLSQQLTRKEFFRPIKADLRKANLEFLPASYISVIFFTTLISVVVSILLFLFLMFFNVGTQAPFISMIEENLAQRFLKVFWIIFVIPLSVFFFMYFYPSMEKKSLGNKINHELPFATLHMAAVSNSLSDPTQIFEIIIKAGEYPNLRREFVKIINEVNVYGLDLVSALRNTAFRSPSKKLSELLNGLATTINSGGDLSTFFEKRSQTLLFEYGLEREKSTRAAETFMDIYISVVIAAPMVLMLLLMMMKVSGLGISLSTGMITLVMILGVSVINVLFITLIHLKQPNT